MSGKKFFTPKNCHPTNFVPAGTNLNSGNKHCLIVLDSWLMINMFTYEEKQASLDVINYQLKTCKSCRLFLTRKHVLAGEGNIDSKIMVVALSPGAMENTHNRMFVGPSGRVFNKLLTAAGIDRRSFYMTNLVKCMLPKNRKPRPDEIEACFDFLKEEINIIRPQVIVPLGYFATRTIFQKVHPTFKDEISFKKVSGQIIDLENRKVLPLPHPASLLYSPSLESDTVKKYKLLNKYA